MDKKTQQLIFKLGRPFSGLYALAMRLRALGYRYNIFKTKRVPRPVISIGNLTLGGTGKTPHVIAICQYLQEKGLRPAVVTRGYGGKAGKGPLVVSDGRCVVTTADVAGDEPVMMAPKLWGVPIVAGSDRYRCSMFAIEEFDASIIVLDDGFQHLRLHRDVDIVLMEASAPFGTGRVFPGGNLREPLSALSRVDAIVLTKCNEIDPNTIVLVEDRVRPLAPDKPIFTSKYELDSIELVAGPQSPSTISEQELSRKRIFCFCALAQPESFYCLVRENGLNICGTMSFPDHHFYTQEDIEAIVTKAKETNCQISLTTEKDFAKIARNSWTTCTDKLGLGIVRVKVNLSDSFQIFLWSRVANL